jgi:hypothetical protein
MGRRRRNEEIAHRPSAHCHLLACLSVRKPGRDMHLQTLGGAGKIALHVPFCAVNVVPQDMQSRPISLCLDGH